jgi:hypothetical protein
MNEKCRSLIFQALGAASMCWTGTPTGTFDLTRCKQIGNELIAALDKEPPATPSNKAKGEISVELVLTFEVN